MYEQITVNDIDYILVHAGLNNFKESKTLKNYQLTDFHFHRTNYDIVYYKNKFLITGHTPTVFICDNRQPLIYQNNHHITIDCGCILGKKLACYCLDNQKEFYIDTK